MALALYGGGITDLRGSVGGNTHSRSKYGSTVRAKTSPIQPRTGHQTGARSQLVNVTNRWSQVLTEAQRLQWNAFALTQPQTNRFGQISYLSGQQWFNKLGVVGTSLTAGNYFTVPPATGTYPSVTGLTFTATHAGAGTMDINYAGTPGVGTPFINIYASQCLTVGTSYVSSKLKLIGAQVATNGAHSILTLWKNRYGQYAPLVGMKVFLLIITANNDDGTSSAGIMINTIVT